MHLGKILVFNGANEEMQIEERVLPEIAPDEILVKNLYTTLCGSDIHTYCGLRHEKTPTVLGHEIVGEIVKFGYLHSQNGFRGEPLNIGDIITWSIFSSDPNTVEAENGMPQKSSNLFKYGHAQVTDQEAFHGGLSEYCVLRKNTTILKVPQNIPLDIAATLNCSVATVAGALRLAKDIKGKRVLITGLGLLGIVCVAMCKDAGAAQIVTADINPLRLQQSLAFGATEALDFDQLIHRSQITHPILTPLSFDLTFDMSGAADAMEAGLSCLGIGGIAIWIGAVFNTRNLQLNPERIVRNLLTIKGLHNYNHEDFCYGVDFMKRNVNQFPFSNIIGKEFSLSQANLAFEYAIQHKPLRVGIRLNH
ncbi:zinc-binding dehydrogenase [Flectobacillus roseus]|uniref:zinc-binding dehydrogenase n=1 Tax=Flectobacillus roseus TaxID=502259 RepID=UPI0036361F91